MRRRVVLFAAIAALLAVPASAIAVHAAAAPTAVGIAQREFRISTYRQTVPPGAVKLNIRNFGQDVHNIVVRGPGGFLAAGPDVSPGKNATFVVNLRKAGTYELLCTRANHLKLGMRAKLVVARPKKR
jgi:plastocyanin